MRVGKLIAVLASATVICMVNACGGTEQPGTTVAENVAETVTEATGSGTKAETKAEKTETETGAATKAYREEAVKKSMNDFLIDAEEGTKSSEEVSSGDESDYDSYRRLHPMNNDLISLEILDAFNEEVEAYIGAPSYKYDAFNGIMEIPDNYLDGDYPAWTALVADWAYQKTCSDWSSDMKKTVSDGYKHYSDNLTAIYGDGSSERDKFVSLYVTYFTLKENGESGRTKKQKEIYSSIQPLITKVHDIIRSLNGISKAGTSNTGANVSALNSADPLKGLVADDILLPFRRENSFNPQGDCDAQTEALLLGEWVQYKLPKPTGEMVQLSTEIGNRYEWLFGTDISNNFHDNFRYYYGYYYALKDYYNSNGRRSYYTYSMMCDNYYFFNSGNPDVEIKQLYSELQLFITASNNALRAKL